MSKATIVRDHNGKLDIRVDGQPVHGANVTTIGTVGEEQAVVVVIPLKHVTFGEADNVVSMSQRLWPSCESARGDAL